VASAPAAETPVAVEKPVSKPASPAEQAQYHAMVGEMAAARDQPRLAAEEFLQAVVLVPDVHLAARATELALTAEDEHLALAGAQKWLELDPTSLNAREVIIRLSLRNGQVEEVYNQCAAVVRDHPGGIDDGFRQIALLLAQEPDHQETGMAVVDRLATQYPNAPGAFHAQAMLALRFDHADTAEKAVRAELKLAPQSREAQLLLVAVLVKKGDITGADAMMADVLKDKKGAGEARMGYARMLIESNQTAHGREQLEILVKSEPGNVDARYALGLIALGENRLDEAEADFTIVGAQPERETEGEYYLGRIAELRKQPESALAHYEKVNSGPQALDALLHRASMLAKLGRLADARAELEDTRDQYPVLAPKLTQAEGEILTDAGALDQALDVYGQALKQNPDDDEVLYARSLVYERLDRIGDAEADLRKVLAGKPDDARALNALGYTLTVHSNRFDEADKLVSKALQITPDDPAVIDSMGWLRFREGRPQDALPLLKKAYDQFPDGEVAAHLVEVMWTLGDKNAARDLWTRAAKQDPDNPVLHDTIKRLGGDR
jgi:tetratricopeptide (TPR) repeat protein